MPGLINTRGVEGALDLLRYLPRVRPHNVYVKKENPVKHRPRGQHGGRTHGHGNKGAKQRCSYPRIGFENGRCPFYLTIPKVYYYKGRMGQRQYPPLSLHSLQLMIDTGRLDPSQPIDLTSLLNTGIYEMNIFDNHFGVHLTDEGADVFNAKVVIEVQHAEETVIAAIERNGGVITNAYYDVISLETMMDPQKFFERGIPIPVRKLPPEDILEFYMDPKFRGYLSDPEKIAEERLTLSQKYGYELPNISTSAVYDLLKMRKDPRQVFYGLEPGWLVNLRDKKIFKPKDELLQKFYHS